MLSKKQAEFIREGNHRWNFKIGATGTGKTYLDFTYLIPQRLRERPVSYTHLTLPTKLEV